MVRVKVGHLLSIRRCVQKPAHAKSAIKSFTQFGKVRRSFSPSPNPGSKVQLEHYSRLPLEISSSKLNYSWGGLSVDRGTRGWHASELEAHQRKRILSECTSVRRTRLWSLLK